MMVQQMAGHCATGGGHRSRSRRRNHYQKQ